MSFIERLQAGRFAVALEITPPQKPLPGVLMRRAGLLGDAAHAVNVIQRPGRQPSLDASIALRESGLHPVWHLVTRGADRDDVRAALHRAHASGVRQLLAIRGDHAGADLPGTPTLRDAIAMAAEEMPGAAIGATLNQYSPDASSVLKNLLPKLRAGASYVQTQPVVEVDRLAPLAEAVRGASPDTRVVAMAMPLLTLAHAERISERIGVTLPDTYLRRIEQGGEAAAWEAFGETLASLAASHLVHGVAIMTFEMDPTPETGERICAALRSAGIG
jgi:5,10-methylenetetrahydrofolate reductase